MEGNQQKMREALEEARRFVMASAQRTDRDLLVTGDEKRGPYVLSPKDTLVKIDAALSAPPRQCDVGTAEEQTKRFRRFCNNTKCQYCNITSNKGSCSFNWAQTPYAENGGAA